MISKTQAQPKTENAAGPGGVSILLVDDHPENLLALETVLGDLGHELVRAGSGKEALKRLLEKDFALILLDVQMPVMDGFETAELIRSRDRSKHTPIIFLTAINKAETHVYKGYSIGAVDYIFKPYSPEVLRAKVSAFVEMFRKNEQLKEQADELRRLNEQLRRSNEELEQFATVASHDLKEPLRKISSFAELLANRYSGKLDDEATQYIRLVVSGATRMQDMISDLLEYSRIGKEERPVELASLDPALDRALFNLEGSMEESRAVVTRDPMPIVKGDVPQLTRLLQNLIGNAIKFRGAEAPRVHVGAQRSGTDWILSIRDNGIGIDPAHHERIFAIFSRLHGRGKYPGNGIGLAICKKIVEQHGGRIWVESEPGKGATFYCALPSDRLPGGP